MTPRNGTIRFSINYQQNFSCENPTISAITVMLLVLKRAGRSILLVGQV